MADNVEDLIKVITDFKEALFSNSKCDLNVDVIRQKSNSESVMLSSFGERLIQNISDIKNILIELDRNMKIPSNSNEEVSTLITEGFNTVLKTLGDLDNKFRDFDFDLNDEVKDFFKCFEGTITSRLSSIEAQIKERERKEDTEEANFHPEMTELWLETIKKDTREKFFKLESFVSRIFETKKEQIKHSFETGFSQQESFLKEKFDNIGTEIKELKMVIETSVLNNENKINNNIPKPECIGCNRKFDASSRIAQCNLGHLMCWDCKEMPGNLRCPTCLQPINGRAYGMEHFLSVLLK